MPQWYSLYLNERTAFLNNITRIYLNVFDWSESTITQILLFGEPSLNDKTTTNILNLTTDYIISAKRLDQQLFIDNWYKTKYLLNNIFFFINSFIKSSFHSYAFILLKLFGAFALFRLIYATYLSYLLLTMRHLKFCYISISYHSSADWQRKQKCKNYIQLD